MAVSGLAFTGHSRLKTFPACPMKDVCPFILRSVMSDQERGRRSGRLFACAVLCTAFVALCAHDVTAQTVSVDESDEPEGFLGLSLEDLMSADRVVKVVFMRVRWSMDSSM